MERVVQHDEAAQCVGESATGGVCSRRVAGSLSESVITLRATGHLCHIIKGNEMYNPIGCYRRLRVYEVACVLGKLMPPRTEQEWAHINWLERLSSDELDRVITRIRLEKTILPAFKNVSHLRQEKYSKNLEFLWERLKPEAERRATFAVRVMPKVRDDISKVLDDHNLKFLFIKGASMDDYPNGYTRQLNDLDIVFEGWEQLFDAVRVLALHGAQIKTEVEPPWFTRLVSTHDSLPEISAHIRMTIQQDERHIGIDIHQSPLPIGAIGELALFLAPYTSAEQVPVPRPEDRLLIMIAHAFNEGFFIAKDFNDAYAIVERRTVDFDWDYLLTRVRSMSLLFAAHLLIDKLHEIYPSLSLPAEAFKYHLTKKDKFNLGTFRFSTWAGTTLMKPILHNPLLNKPWIEEEAGLSLRDYFQYITHALRHAILVTRAGDSRIASHLFNDRRSVLFPRVIKGLVIYLVPIMHVAESIDEAKLRYIVTMLHDEIDVASFISIASNLPTTRLGNKTILLRLYDLDIVFTPVDIYIASSTRYFSEAAIERADLAFAEISRLLYLLSMK